MTLRRRFFLLLLLAQGAAAHIYLDHEQEPLPRVDISVQVPGGMDSSGGSKSDVESAALQLVGSLMDTGTATLDRQAFQDALAAFGADFSFTVGQRYSTWSLNFPWDPKRDYTPLIKLLTDNWQRPRFQPKEFQIVKTRALGQLKASVDSDAGLLNGVMRRFLLKKVLGGAPLFMETLERTQLEHVQRVFQRDITAVSHVWMGVLGPREALPVVRQLAQSVFSLQGALSEGRLERPLKVRETQPATLAQRTFFIVEKPGRAQTLIGLTALSRRRWSTSAELPMLFGNHLLLNSGPSSYFYNEVRTSRGLAYYVQSQAEQYLGFEQLGYVSNPQKDKQQQAFEVFGLLTKKAFEDGSYFAELPDADWQRQQAAFANQVTLSKSTAGARLSERGSVVVGLRSPAWLDLESDDLRVDRSRVRAQIADAWKESAIVAAAVGESKELKPLIEKHFPGYRIVTVPYRDTVSEQSLRYFQ